MATITGTSLDDQTAPFLTGTTENDTYFGLEGSDLLFSSAGNDTIDGGPGDQDTADYRNDPAGIDADLSTGLVIDGYGDTDTLIGIEFIRGSAFGDRIVGVPGTYSIFFGLSGDDTLTGANDDRSTDLSGGQGNDTLTGGTGGAYFQPGSGSDLIIGGTEAEGTYLLNYFWDAVGDAATTGISVTFSGARSGTVTDYSGATDTFSGIAQIEGTDLADFFTGQAGRQDFRGQGGNDFFDGGADEDRVDYTRSISDFGIIGGVTVDLQAGSATDTYGDTDTLINIEWIRGSEFADDIRGDGQENFFEGLEGNDLLVGLAGDDALEGGDGNDTVNGGSGNDCLEGGAGTDTALYTGAQTSYTLTLSSDGASLTDRRADGEGTDNLMGIEYLDFDTDLQDGPFFLQQFSGPAGLSAQQLESFIELYIAYFNRAPDALGLNFWGTQFVNGFSLQEIAALFIDQDETRATYPESLSNADFATAVYGNVLGRTPDQDGYDYWVDQLDSGLVGRDVFILAILGGAKAPPPADATQDFIDQQLADRQYLSDKTDIGAYFAVHGGMSDVANATAAMLLFDGSESGIDAAVNAIDGYLANAEQATTGEFLMPILGVLDDPFTM
ncbi:MAG: DUF4214 domain-containing protein [Sulfitobacter sp.]|nr:DUF4214 domain-containing protein [Sulfitobacter sp.]